MSVRVIGRIRPLLPQELEKDVIVSTRPSRSDPNGPTKVVAIPNPKNDAELYSFQFHGVYEQDATQQQLFENEGVYWTAEGDDGDSLSTVAPTIKHLYKGVDVTLFAYGVTGTGKTHTMRGGKSLAERGVIPRLLSSIFRRARKIEKESDARKSVQVHMSYYEIYNDRVYDLFEPAEKRTTVGLPIRDNGSKSIVVGLLEKPCSSLKEFELLYDQANVNRSTCATKLNAHSSRSHAILCVKLTQTAGDEVLISRVSAIDLAGSEDNRRTGNDRDRMVESASINKSLFVLAQCVEAISKKQSRIPYRESKMTRILSLGQNNGLTVMILNLTPVRAFHLDTLSSLNFANRTKKIEVNEVENEPMFRPPPAKISVGGSLKCEPMRKRQPLQQLLATENISVAEGTKRKEQVIVRTISVYQDKACKPVARPTATMKRPLDMTILPAGSRPKVIPRATGLPREGMSKLDIEALIEQRLDEKLAERAMKEPAIPVQALPADLQHRLDMLEEKVSKKENSEGLQYLLMAKQHAARGEDNSALVMYQLAQPFFPNNVKLANKISSLHRSISQSLDSKASRSDCHGIRNSHSNDGFGDQDDGESAHYSRSALRLKRLNTSSKPQIPIYRQDSQHTPRTQKLLDIINSREIVQIKQLRGVGAKKAEAIVSSLLEMENGEDCLFITDLEQLGGLKGVGWKSLETMKAGLVPGGCL